jgi:hypothetical protein
MKKYVVTTVDVNPYFTPKQAELIRNLPFEDDVFDNKNGDAFFPSDDIDLSKLEVFKRGSLEECKEYFSKNIDVNEQFNGLFEIREDAG